jgi:SPP1 family predicted phage head-tail adaptor
VSPVSAGRRVHLATVQAPGAPVPDGDGGFAQTWTTLVEVRVAIEPATARVLERLIANTSIISQATHVITMPYVAGVTTESRVLFGAREWHVLGVIDPEERHRELILTCIETVL